MDLEDRFSTHRHNGADTPRLSLGDLDFSKGASISEPSGGLTVDSEARTAINAIISRLEALGLIDTN